MYKRVHKLLNGEQMSTNDINERCDQMKGRRGATRNRFSGEIEIDWNSTVLTGRVRDISRQGMFIEIAERPTMGSIFSARLNLGTPLPIQCVVQRIALCQGIGVTFTLVDDMDSRQRLNALLRVLRRAGRRAEESCGFSPDELFCFASSKK